jgi:glyoxylase-like metal-dependent hydrolase (beta-lactamase superfamily II)
MEFIMDGENNYEVHQIDDASWRIDDGPARMFLFAGANRALLVDGGYGKGNLAETVAGLTKLPVMLVNTHADYDHIGANSQFPMAHMHPAEFARYRMEVGRFFPEANQDPPVSPVWDGDVIELGGRSFEVILIPGHSPGSIALLDAQNHILIGGDSVIADIIAMGDPWRDFGAYICSIRKLIGMRDRFDTVYTSHGTFPVGADILDGLLDGATRVKNGEIQGVDTEFIKDRKLYDTGAAKFVC